MRIIRTVALIFLANAALMGAASAQLPDNLFFQLTHIKPGSSSSSLPIATILGSGGSSESYQSRAIPVETKTSAGTTLSSVQQFTGFGATISTRRGEGSTIIVDVTYTVKDRGATAVSATKTFHLEHGQSIDLPVKDAEKLVLSLY